jgi:hypothetical protein
MAWFRNHYVCAACEGHWILECVEVQDEHCPHCRAYDVTPYRSDDLTVLVAAPTASEDELVGALKAAAVQMRGDSERPRGRRAASRVVLH